MIIKFASFVIDVDVERTRAFYERADIPTMSQQCKCINCQNFDSAILEATDEILSFLRSFGIDPQKPAESFNTPGTISLNGMINYAGWYHICGSILKGPETIKEVPTPSSLGVSYEYIWDHAYIPDSNFDFSILPVKKIDLLHDEFPSPAIQFWFNTNLPYVLPYPSNLEVFDIDNKSGV